MRLAVFGTMWNEEVMMYYYRGFNQWAQETSGIVDLFVCHGRTNLENSFNVGEYAIFDLPDLSGYDGVVMIASNINQEEVREHLVQRVRQANIPCVVVDYEIEGFSRIYIDQENCIRQMVHHLCASHHIKNAAYLGGLSSNVEGTARMNGFLQGMKECGLPVREDWIFERRFRYNDGLDVVCELLQRKEEFPDAIVCANDDMAAGACEALDEAGIEVGKECLVTGFDQYFLGENYAPSITTVRRPRESIAYHACQMIQNYTEPYALKEQANLSFGQTCGCGVPFCKNDIAFRKHVFGTFNNRDIFSAMLAHMEEGMIAGDSIDDIVESMEKFFCRFQKGRCRIVLHPDVESRPNATYHSYRTCTKEYFLWQNENEKDNIEGHAYVYAPIHFLEHLYGYCVFRDIPQFLNNKELYNFTKSIGFSLENMVQKNKYALVNDKLEDLYETDYLTGVYNRHGFAKYAEEMLAECRREGVEMQVIFVDIDGLKKINDQYGHEAGDVVIRTVGHSVSEVADERTKVFRYGGDEFLVLHKGEGEFPLFCKHVKRVIDEKREAMHLPYPVSASAGCVIAIPGEMKTLEEYVKEADHVMYGIKQERHRQAQQ